MLWLLLGKGRGSKEATSVWAHLGLSHPHSILSTSYWFVKTTKETRRFSKIAVPNKILKNTSKFIWRPKESIYETLKRWYHAGARDATWKGFPVVILMPYAYQHSSHPAFSRRPSWNKSESLFFKMSTQFSIQAIPQSQNLSPFVVSGFFKNPSSSQVDQSIWWGRTWQICVRNACSEKFMARPSRETTRLNHREPFWETWKNQPCGCFQK